MVGLVIVSHSRALAEALLQLVGQVAPAGIPIAVAAGVGEGSREFGTNAIEISEAIQSVYSSDGVLVLMDLGSAILSAEMALELLPSEMASHIRFCPAPLVEGAIAAGVQIGLGSSLETACKEAEQSLLPKSEQLQSQPANTGPAAEPPVPAPASGLPGDDKMQAEQMTLTLNNQHGLHARPASRFIQAAGQWNAKTQVTNLTTGKGPVSATSLNALATLGAVKGHQVQITAAGPEARQALDALRQLVEDNFGETEEMQAASPVQANPAPVLDVFPARLRATPVSEGIALGPLYYFQAAAPSIPRYRAEDPDQEKLKLKQAIDQVRRDIEQRYRLVKTSVGEKNAAIFDAHLLMLQDPDITERVNHRIEANQENAAVAWSTVMNEIAEAFRELPDAYQQQRAADVIDITNQVLFALLGQATPAPAVFDQPVILFAPEITPTETAQLDMGKVLGILTSTGGPTSHSAILARALGIPSITGVPPAFSSRIKPGTLLAIDGFTGDIQIDPPPEIQREFQALRQAWIDRRRELIQQSRQPALTRDGRRVEVYANVGNLMDARAAVRNGAEGIGLLRTEFLFLTRETPPSEAEQLTILSEIGDVLGDRPITVRTLDVGGDKEIPYIRLAKEGNPFLGVRAIRMSLSQPDLFRTQLRAILRAAARYKIRIMFPMIAQVEEVRHAREWLEKAHQSLLAENLPHAWPVETGIMVEIPSAALLSRAFADEVDFFSIGTNDLTQYTLAAERGNPQLAGLSDALHPAVLRLIREVVVAAHARGKPVSVCGELAGDAEATAVLVGLGVDELSLNPAGIPLIKDTLRRVDSAQSAVLAEQALQATCAADVRRMSQEFLKET